MPFHHLLISRRLVAHEVDHPAPVWAGGGGSRGAAGRAGTGFPLAGPVVRTVLPGPAPVSPSARMRRSTVHRATPGPSCRELRSRQVFLDPSVALNGSALRARILSIIDRKSVV